MHKNFNLPTQGMQAKYETSAQPHNVFRLTKSSSLVPKLICGKNLVDIPRVD